MRGAADRVKNSPIALVWKERDVAAFAIVVVHVKGFSTATPVGS
jgi:hypothetical protein